MRTVNPLCFVLRTSRIIGVFPVEFVNQTLRIHGKLQLWSAFVLIVYYFIELSKFKNDRDLQDNIGSYQFLILVTTCFSNFNTLLNFVYILIVLKHVLPLLNTLIKIYHKMNIKMTIFFKFEIIVIITALPSLANMFYLFYSVAYHKSNLSIAARIRLTLYTLKSMSYTCISWQFCSICCVITVLMSEINKKISELGKRRHRCNLDELREFFSSLCEICHKLNDFFGCFTLFYLILANIHFQTDLFIVVKNVYNLIIGEQAQMWGFWGLWNRLFWSISSLLKIFSITWSITRLTSQVTAQTR